MTREEFWQATYLAALSNPTLMQQGPGAAERAATNAMRNYDEFVEGNRATLPPVPPLPPCVRRPDVPRDTGDGKFTEPQLRRPKTVADGNA